jgi:hypothetical protein
MPRGNRRYGKFKLYEGMFETKEGLQEIEQIFTKMGFVPVKIDYEPWQKSFTYYGYSHKFEELEIGTMAPEYVIICRAGKTLLGEKEIIGITVEKID